MVATECVKLCRPVFRGSGPKMKMNFLLGVEVLVERRRESKKETKLVSSSSDKALLPLQYGISLR